MSETRDTQESAVQVPRQSGAEGEMGASARAATAPTPRYAEPPPTPSAWTGWIVFGSMMMIMLGTFQAIAGFAALFDDGYFAVTKSGLLVNVDYTVWGWVHLALAAIVIGTGVGLMSGKGWARVTGIIVALVSAVVNLGFLSAYPLWASSMIVLDVIVIYAITVHGGEMKEMNR